MQPVEARAMQDDGVSDPGALKHADRDQPDADLQADLDKKRPLEVTTDTAPVRRPRAGAVDPGNLPRYDTERPPEGVDLSLGIVRCGAHFFGIPIRNLAEIAQVTRLRPLSQTAAHGIGALELRGALVPVFSLSALAGRPSDMTSPPAFAAILRSGDRLLGVGVDEIGGMIRYRASAVQTLSTGRHDDRQDDHRATGHAGDSWLAGCLLHDDRLITILDADALARRPDIICGRRAVARSESDRTEDTSPAHVSLADGERERLLVFSVGGADFGLRATAIQGTVPRTAIDDNALNAGACIGSITHHRQRIPVLRTHLLTGLGQPTEDRSAEIVLLRVNERRRVGLAVDRIDRMLTAGMSDLRPIPAALQGAGQIVLGALPSEDGRAQVFVLSPERLLQSDTVSELARLSDPPKATRARAGNAAPAKGGVTVEQQRYLIFEAGTLLAAPAQQIRRIIVPPRAVTDAHSRAIRGLVGIFQLDGKPVTLVDLACHLGLLSAGKAPSRVLVVNSGAHLIGLAVHKVVGIDTSAWRRREGPDGAAGTIVQLGRGARRRILPALDLDRIARSILCEAAPEPPSQPAPSGDARASRSDETAPSAFTAHQPVS